MSDLTLSAVKHFGGNGKPPTAAAANNLNNSKSAYLSGNNLFRLSNNDTSFSLSNRGGAFQQPEN